MKKTISSYYGLFVLRGKMIIPYSSTPYPSVADARVAAKRLGEYVEIRKVATLITTTLIERVEP